jgi:hypothetical protein
VALHWLFPHPLVTSPHGREGRACLQAGGAELDDSDWDAGSDGGEDAGGSAEDVVDAVVEGMVARLAEAEPVVEWLLHTLLEAVHPRGELALRVRAQVSQKICSRNAFLINSPTQQPVTAALLLACRPAVVGGRRHLGLVGRIKLVLEVGASARERARSRWAHSGGGKVAAFQPNQPPM